MTCPVLQQPLKEQDETGSEKTIIIDCSRVVYAHAPCISGMFCEVFCEPRVSGLKLNVTSQKVKACDKSHHSSRVAAVCVKICGLDSGWLELENQDCVSHKIPTNTVKFIGLGWDLRDKRPLRDTL